ncbi:MAG: hypothetical protein ACTHM9_14080 [Gemmatimonadales bacterium]
MESPNGEGRATSSKLLGELVARARRSAEHSAYLIRRARALCVRCADATIVSQMHHNEREAWADILAHVPSDPDHRVVLCARCHRARGDEGWTNLPMGIEHELKHWQGALVSHGYCPECMLEMEAATHHVLVAQG